MSRKFVIGIDSSTTSCKAIAWDCEGRSIAEGRSSIRLSSPAVGWYEQDAEEWWSSLVRALNDLGKSVDLHLAEAICLTHQRETFVPVDEQGRPIRAAITWMDERSRDQLATIERSVGKDRFHRITGKPLSTTVSLPKLLWLYQHEPNSVSRANKILDVHAFLVHRLTGLYRTSPGSADPTGLLDIQQGTWSEELAALAGIRLDQLCELVPVGREIGRVNQHASRLTGLPSGLPVIAGIGDGQAAGLGANVTTAEIAYLNLGTCVIGGFFSPDYVCDLAFRTMSAPLAGTFFLEHALKGGVFTVTWFIDRFAADLKQLTLSLTPEEILETAASKLPPGSEGLMLVPYWNNVMDPYWDPLATGIVIGWNGSHAREHFYRAILEGIAFEQRLSGDAVMKALNRRIKKYVTMGGGSKSELWCQIIADVTNTPVVRADTAEATCLGAGILAAAAVGWYADVNSAADSMTREGKYFEPNQERHLLYDKLYNEVYVHIFPSIRQYVDRLTELTRE